MIQAQFLDGRGPRGQPGLLILALPEPARLQQVHERDQAASPERVIRAKVVIEFGRVKNKARPGWTRWLLRHVFHPPIAGQQMYTQYLLHANELIKERG